MHWRKKKYAGKSFTRPLDFSWSVNRWRFYRRMRPTMLMLAELELWPNWILATCSAGVKVAIVNVNSEKSFRGYGRVKWLVASLLWQAVDRCAKSGI
ncbi:MAG: glycosyltransferase N-terminal domain-containing protein [Pirellulales bacterium]